jgi:cobalt-zinc-cadmium efflux system protein
LAPERALFMPHDHTHHHSHAAPVANVNTAFVAGIVLNSAYVLAEAIAGFMTHSVALLSDAGHNLSDVAALGLSLFAFRLAKMKPTSQYTYGYKKTTILAALTNAVVLLIAIGMLGYESVSRLYHPQPVQGGIIAWVAAAGIIINSISAFLFFRNKEHDLNTKGAYLHLLTDALVSAVVVVTGIIISYTHLYLLDGVVSIIVLLVILYSTWSLMRDSLRLSLDAVPADIDMDEITGLIKNMKGVTNIHHTHIWAMSTTQNALTAHVVMDDRLGFDEKMKLVQNIKHELQHHNIQHATIELESKESPCEEEAC